MKRKLVWIGGGLVMAAVLGLWAWQALRPGAGPGGERQVRRKLPPEAPGQGLEQRLALVIGNSAYRHIGPLANPGNDAQAVAAALQQIGFELVDGKALVDLSLPEMRKAMGRFGEKLKGKQVGLFYYAGHGTQAAGKNYLIPVTAQLTGNVSPTDVKYELVDVQDVLEAMALAGSQVNIVILDACRDNPFGLRGYRSAESGLAELKAAKGTLIAYATAPGKVAADGQGGHSPYTRALSQAMRQPGLRIEDIFMQVGDRVEKETARQQEPWYSSNLRGIFYFAQAPGKPAESAAAPGAADRETLFWQSIMGSKNPQEFKEYLKIYPGGVYAGLAQEKIRQLTAAPAAPQRGDIWPDPVTGMELVWIPGGTFQMGSPDSEKERSSDEGPVHEVELTGFWLGRYEVTRGQFRKFVEAAGYRTEAEKEGWSDGFKDGKWDKQQGMNWRQPGFTQDDTHPVVCVSWNDAQAMEAWLSRQGHGEFRLPSEAQWEYACRGGTTTARFWGDNADEACKYANVGDKSLKQAWTDWSFTIHNCADGYVHTAPAGRFRPNGFGLYDMLGNVWEWCADIYSGEAYKQHRRFNPIYTDTSKNSHRVLRGGSWYFGPVSVRCASRLHGDPSSRIDNIGFRLSRTP